MSEIPSIERRTKTVCTIGPATSSRAQLRALLERGMNVARLNFAHGEPSEHGAILAWIRALSEELGVPTAVLQDLAGPKVRIGTVAGGSVELEPGHRFTLTTRPIEGSRDRASGSYARLPAEVGVGDTLLLADGVIQLRVERMIDEDIHCEVVVGGRLGSRKGVNVPSRLPGLPSSVRRICVTCASAWNRNRLPRAVVRPLGRGRASRPGPHRAPRRPRTRDREDRDAGGSGPFRRDP